MILGEEFGYFGKVTDPNKKQLEDVQDQRFPQRWLEITLILLTFHVLIMLAGPFRSCMCSQHSNYDWLAYGSSRWRFRNMCCFQLNRHRDGLCDRRLGFDSQQRKHIFLFSTATRTVQHPIQPSVHLVMVVPSSGVKLPGSEANHVIPSSAEVNNAGTKPVLPHMLSWSGA
jgi:hypothetical protein